MEMLGVCQENTLKVTPYYSPSLTEQFKGSTRGVGMEMLGVCQENTRVILGQYYR